MDSLTVFLSNPFVGAVGYILSFIAAVIAIYQFFAKSEAKEAASQLNIKVESLTEENSLLRLELNQIQNMNNVHQGDKSQYFQDNNGPVSIDMRD